MIKIIKILVYAVILSLVLSTVSVAEDNGPAFVDKVNHMIGSGGAKRPLIFTAPPRNDKKDNETYGPIIDYLGDTLQRKIEYRKPSGWGDYTKAMINDVADIVFDGPHFNAWRMNKLGHRIIVRLPQQQVWKIIVGKNSAFKNIDELTGQKACLQGATNYGKLKFMQFFPNALRLPQEIQISSRQDGYNAVINGTCATTILTEAELNKYNKKYKQANKNNEPPVRVLLTTKPSPNQAFSVSARLSRAEQDKIQTALLSPQGQLAMSVLRDRYAGNKELVAANQVDYLDIDDVLAGSYPFDNPFKKPITEAYGVGNEFRQRKEHNKDEEEEVQTAREKIDH